MYRMLLLPNTLITLTSAAAIRQWDRATRATIRFCTTLLQLHLHPFMASCLDNVVQIAVALAVVEEFESL